MKNIWNVSEHHKVRDISLLWDAAHGLLMLRFTHLVAATHWENTLYNLLCVITSENIKPSNTHTHTYTNIRQVVAQTPSSSAPGVCGWAFLTSFCLRCWHKCGTWRTERAGRRARESCRVFFLAGLKSTLHQLHREHVAAVSGHRSLCRDRQEVRWLGQIGGACVRVWNH